jgi:transcriptional regulator with XRE-family HTH domain
MTLLTSCQYRAARAILQWTLEELSERSEVSVSTLRRIEAHPGVPSLSTDVFQKVVGTFERARIRFLPDDGSPNGGPGVLWTYPSRGTPDDPVKVPDSAPIE